MTARLLFPPCRVNADHPGRVRRLHQHLRHPAFRRGRGHVPIYYESHLAKLALDEQERPKIDPEFEEATEGEEVERRERLKTKWAQLEAVVGAEKRVKQIAEDIVAHFEQRLEALDGRGVAEGTTGLHVSQYALPVAFFGGPQSFSCLRAFRKPLPTAHV